MQESLNAKDPLSAAVFESTRVSVAAEQQGDQECVVNIFKITLIAGIYAKDELRLKRKEDLNTVKDKALVKARKMVEVGGDVASAVEVIVKKIQDLHALAEVYLDNEFEPKLASLKTHAKAATIRSEVSDVRASLGETFKEMNVGAVRTFTNFVNMFNMQRSSAGCKTNSRARRA